MNPIRASSHHATYVYDPYPPLVDLLVKLEFTNEAGLNKVYTLLIQIGGRSTPTYEIEELERAYENLIRGSYENVCAFQATLESKIQKNQSQLLRLVESHTHGLFRKKFSIGVRELIDEFSEPLCSLYFLLDIKKKVLELKNSNLQRVQNFYRQLRNFETEIDLIYAEYVSLYGEPDSNSPYLDRLAKIEHELTSITPSLSKLSEGLSALQNEAELKVLPISTNLNETAQILFYHNKYLEERKKAFRQAQEAFSSRLQTIICYRFYENFIHIATNVKDELSAVGRSTPEKVIGNLLATWRKIKEIESRFSAHFQQLSKLETLQKKAETLAEQYEMKIAEEERKLHEANKKFHEQLDRRRFELENYITHMIQEQICTPYAHEMGQFYDLLLKKFVIYQDFYKEPEANRHLELIADIVNRLQTLPLALRGKKIREFLTKISLAPRNTSYLEDLLCNL